MIDSLVTFFEEVISGDEQAIIILASVYFAIVGFLSGSYCFWIRTWATIEGQMLGSDIEKLSPAMRPDNQNYAACVRYAYNVDGIGYEGNRLSPTIVWVTANLRFVLDWQMRGIERLGADRVTVLYNPSKPNKSYLIKPGLATFFLPVLCMLVAIMLPLM